MVADHVKAGWIILMSYNARLDAQEQTWERGYMELRVRTEYTPVVLMGRTTLHALSEEVRALRHEVKTLRPNVEQLSALRSEHEKLKVIASQQESLTRSAMDREQAERGKRIGIEAIMHKLEDDLSKVRAAIGEIRMKEILANKASP